MYLFLYNIFLALYRASIKIAALKNGKAKQWLEGRSNIFSKLEQAISPNDKIIWFHCASLGEFEQGRPVMEQLKSAYPGYKILLTFFSPSGYEVRKKYAGADYIFYLPLDSKANAKKFLACTHPALVLFVKYEFWYYYLDTIRQQNVPLLLLSAVFRPTQPFFKWYGSFYKKMLACFTHIFVQDKQSKELLQTIGISAQVSIAGDTRFDRVMEIADQFERIETIEKYCAGYSVIVAGSTWPGDEQMLQGFIQQANNPAIKMIIAPHEINKEHLDALQQLFTGSILYSTLATIDPAHIVRNKVLIIDNIGMLSRLYKYGYITYVGGGFTPDGIHNILEAAVYGKPVLIGPTYSKYREAVELIDTGGAISFSTQEELNSTVSNLLNSKEAYAKAGKSAEDYVRSNAGATATIIQFIQENRLLTN